MKKTTVICALLCSLFLNVITIKAQAPSIQWQKSLGGTDFDQLFSIEQTNDGGYITAGSSNSQNGNILFNKGYNDYLVVKLDNMGSVKWLKSLGGSDEDVAYSIIQTVDGGYIAAGASFSNDYDVTGNHGNADFWIVKLDTSGIIQWQKSIGGSGDDYAYSIEQTNDGGYIVAGSSNSNDGDVTGNHGDSDFWVVKLSNIGVLQWQKSFGGSGLEEAKSLKKTIDGGCIIAGYSYSNNGDVIGNNGDRDYWVIKLDSLAAIQWTKSLGGANYDEASSIMQTTDSGYVIAGESYSNNGNVISNNGLSDYWLLKLNNNGNIQWQKSYGGSENDKARCIQQTSDGGYIVTGWTQSDDSDVLFNHLVGEQDYWILKLDGQGIIQWQKSLGGSSNEVAKCIKETNDGGYIVAGFSDSNDGDLTSYQGGDDCWIIKLGPTTTGTNNVNFNHKINIYPNPNNGLFTIYMNDIIFDEVEVKDVLGRTVFSSILNNKNVNISIEDKNPGIYFVILKKGNINESFKILKR